jgi:phenylacetic acid degradation protein paaN
MSIAEKHKNKLDEAVNALHERKFYAAYPEFPGAYPKTADEEGKNKFESLLNKKFYELRQRDPEQWIGVEESPYTQEPLNIKYPALSVETLISRSDKAYHIWRKVAPGDRAALLVESLERIKERFFEIAYATMHTTGQGYMMAFQASGPHAADRAMEAIATGFEELNRFPQRATWDKPMGKFNITMDKEWRAVPKGIGLVIGCSTFPTWNTVPGMYASLVTGNPVVVKPHPGAVLPIAIIVAEIQRVLEDNGYTPDICQLAVDSYDEMIAKDLAEHKKVKLIDFTGNSKFGSYLERLEGKNVFTEKTGVNSVILDSVEDADKVAANLAFSLSLYSGQMCTAPQNFYIPEGGIKTPQGTLTFDDFAKKLSEQIQAIASNPKAGPFVLGAIQNKNTCERVAKAKDLGGKVWLESTSIENPMFKNARINTPVLIEVDASEKKKFSSELFGPIALLIKTKDTDHSIALAREMAEKHGAISCGAYTTDADVKEKIADEMSLAATPVSFNLTGHIYMNQNAGFSDFHVSGGNPSGNASFTNPEYVIKRFTWVGHREPVKG